MTSGTNTVELATGVTLEYVERGDESGTPVLLLHGVSDSWHSFERVLERLPRSIRALALSQRGHGDSTRPEQAYAWRDFSADVAAFLDALGIDSAVIVGHSMGSTVAQRFALDHPERTRALVLVASFLSLPRSQASEELSAAVAELEDPVDPEFVREFQASTIERPIPEELFETVVEESRKLPARVWREVVEGTRRDEFSAELDAIEAPALVVWGDRDAMVPRSDAEAQERTIPDARLVVYEGTGHAVPWEEPERLAGDVTRFVSRVAA